MSKKLKIDHATSFYDDISFYSKRHKKCIARASITEDGIVTFYGKKEEISTEKKSFAQAFAMWAGIITLSIALFILLVWLVYILKPKNEYGFLLFLMSVFTIAVFVIRTTIDRHTKKGISSFKFHSAEHMAIQAMKKLQRVPTMEEIKCFSRFDKNCGTNLTTLLALNHLIISICFTFLNGSLFLIVTSSCLLLTLLLKQLGCLNFLQYLSTIPPSDRELKVAIAGLKVWFENETDS
jgi:uncharacterized protein YqhQ